MSSDKKPQNIEEYKSWLKTSFDIQIDSRTKNHYDLVASKIHSDFGKSPLWVKLNEHIPQIHQSYQVQKGYPLFVSMEKPQLLIKSFDSFLLKSYRKNILLNRDWPREPKRGWTLPSNWFEGTNDIVRTLLVVKYLDGIEFLIDWLKSESGRLSLQCNSVLEARDEGYYAAHFYLKIPFEVPDESWDTRIVNVSVEIQITTQLQEVIRKLLHQYYERQRAQVDFEKRKWQWDYRGEEFSANYLGHILHYLEGTIMEIRDRREEKS